MDTPSGATLEHGERGGSADHDQRRTVESADVQSRGSTPTPTPTAEPVTPTPVPTAFPTATPAVSAPAPAFAPTIQQVSPLGPEPTVAPAAPVFAGSSEQWRGLVASVFPAWAVDTALRIIQCESKGNPGATGGLGERGLFQIHPVHPDSTYDPLGNVQAAYRISAGGQNWSAWTCR